MKIEDTFHLAELWIINMAKKLLEQDEAAKFLGVTVEKLNELRDLGKIFAKRDGAVQKYDQEALERYKQEVADESGDSWDNLSLDDIKLEDNDTDSILVSEPELGESPETTKSTIIGRNKNPAASDIQLAGESDLKMKDEGGTKGGGSNPGKSDIFKAEGSGLSLADSKPDLQSGSLSGSNLFEDIELAGLGIEAPGSGSLKLAGESQLNLADGSTGKGKNAGDTGAGKDAFDSGLMLADDDDLVLGGGSDITMGAADSGIMLVDPADSGLALDALAGSSKKQNDDLVVGEEDMITLEEVDLEGATQLRSDEEFALTPGGSLEDESDSGSQVIALEAEEDMGGAGMFGASDSGLLDGGGVPLTDSMPQPSMMQVATVPAVRFSGVQVACLSICVLFLAVGGMMVYDLAQNIWSWDTPYKFQSGIIEPVVGMFEK